MKTPSFPGIISQAAIGIASAGLCIWAASEHAAWSAGFVGFSAGANLVFALGDLRDRYRILSGTLT